MVGRVRWDGADAQCVGGNLILACETGGDFGILGGALCDGLPCAGARRKVGRAALV